jgi:outer membrane lipoprotein LolB
MPRTVSAVYASRPFLLQGRAALLLGLAMGLWLSGCSTAVVQQPESASIPPLAIQHQADRTDRVPTRFGLLARFSLQLEAALARNYQPQRFAGSLDWTHDSTTQQTLLLSGPFGQGLAQVTVDENGARLRTRDGQHAHAESAAALLAQLGYPLPLDDLERWLFGQGSSEARLQRDATGRTVQLNDRGWQIRYDYADARQPYPSHLSLRRDSELELQLTIESWQD